MDVENLRDRLLSQPYVVRLTSSEREFLVDLVEASIQNLGRKKIADQKAVAVAQHVIWLEKFHGIKTEAAIASAQQAFDLGRTRVTDILREQRPNWDSIRSAASSDAVLQAYAMIVEERASLAKEGAPDRMSHIEWLEQLAIELPMLVKAEKEVAELANAIRPES